MRPTLLSIGRQHSDYGAVCPETPKNARIARCISRREGRRLWWRRSNLIPTRPPTWTRLSLKPITRQGIHSNEYLRYRAWKRNAKWWIQNGDEDRNDASGSPISNMEEGLFWSGLMATTLAALRSKHGAQTGVSHTMIAGAIFSM